MVVSEMLEAHLLTTSNHQREFAYVTVPGKRNQFGNLKKIELLLPQGRVGFELQNALHI